MTERKSFALVTGTSSGIGAAVADQLLHGGWEVVGIARRPSPVENARYRHLALDLREIATSVETIEDQIGPRLSGGSWDRVALVNNAADSEAAPIERLDARELASVFALNAIVPIWLMSFVASRSPRATPIRIVNVSSGAAVRALPGLATYCSSKAALRMAGMVFGSELELPAGSDASKSGTRDIAILSYEPGVVDTAMQLRARSKSREELPSVELFQRFHREGLLAPPEAPAAEIVEFVQADGHAHFTERRRG